MTIQSEIDRIKSNINETYQTVEDMGGTLPEQQNSDSLAEAVSTIPSLSSLTGTPGEVVGFDSTGKAAAVQGWSNPNLLLNWDFRNPINRNEGSVYLGNGYNIDMWLQSANNRPSAKVVINDGSILVDTGGPDQARVFFSQYLTVYLSDSEDYTLSFLTGSGLFSMTANGGAINNATTDFLKKFTPFGFLEFVIIDGKVKASMCVDTGKSEEVIAAKLESGVRQTLARQNADGAWVIIDSFDYPDQCAKCFQYDSLTGEFIGMAKKSNPNLLDNWYFLDPINQTGETEYGGNKVAFDRWETWVSDGTSTVVTLENDGLHMFNGTLIQKMTNDDFLRSIGKTFTISLLTSSGLAWTTGIIKEEGNPTALGSQKIDGVDIVFANFNIASQRQAMRIQKNNDTPITLIAAKFEFSAYQTLAHKEGGTWVLNDPPPNKTLELAKCQAYRLVLNEIYGIVGNGIFETNSLAWILIPTPTAMRSTPTITYNKLYVSTKNHFNENGIPVTSIDSIRNCRNGIRIRVNIDSSEEDFAGQAAMLQVRNSDGYMQIKCADY